MSTAKSMLSPTFRPRRPSSVIRVVGLTVILVLCFLYLEAPAHGSSYLRTYHKFGSRPADEQTGSPDRTDHEPKESKEQKPLDAQADTSSPMDGQRNRWEHPIDKLIRDAEDKFSRMTSTESQTVEEAAARYRERRGRHPPPGFDEWYHFAWANRALVVEEFWDQIYEDLEPFWAIPPAEIRKGAWDFEMTIKVRNGTASARSDWFWTQIWLDMIQRIENLLPDMDIALNAMDEPRIVVPWEQIDKYMAAAGKTRKLFDPKDAVKTFQVLPEPGKGPDRAAIGVQKSWEKTQPYWKIARQGCPPNSEARRARLQASFDGPPDINQRNSAAHTYQGFVSNTTLATSICHQPDLQGLQGIFIEPLSVSSTRSLFPMFGGSKLSVNNEILLPAPMYWSGNERFVASGNEETALTWGLKLSQAFWRGVATGGRARESNWRGFQRHRFVAMNNGTQLKRAAAEAEATRRDSGAGAGFTSSSSSSAGSPPRSRPRRSADRSGTWAENFVLPAKSYGLASQKVGRLGDWTDSWSSTVFTDLNCQPKNIEQGTCPYTSPFYELSEGVSLADMFNYKYLPDVDGNSFSGRYLSFLRSTSLPIKSTLFREWHDSRLVPWKHFVPMDPRFGDWHAIMEYFLGYGDPDTLARALPHDAQAERIATAGKEWAEKVLRREDMLVYVLRLLLEYARVSDERRESMGWVDDLLPRGGGNGSAS